MIDPAYFIGAPKEFHQKCLIYPPTVKEVVANSKFGQYLQILTLSQDDLNYELRDKLKPDQQMPTPLEFLLANCYNSKEYLERTKEAFMLFTRQEITLLYDQKKILFGDLEKLLADKVDINMLTYLSEEDFFDFQNMVREASGGKPIKPPEPEDPTEDPRVRRLKEKAKERDRVKAKKGTAGGISLTTCIVAVCCMGIGVTPMTIGEMSYAALSTLMSMFQEKEKYDIDVRSVLAGADPKKVKPKYWIRNLDN